MSTNSKNKIKSNLNPNIEGLVYSGHRRSSESVKWHSDRFDRPWKDVGNEILQIVCSFEEKKYKKTSLK